MLCGNARESELKRKVALIFFLILAPTPAAIVRPNSYLVLFFAEKLIPTCVCLLFGVEQV